MLPAKSEDDIAERLRRLGVIAIQGNLVETFLRCGKAACACAQDPARRHGPHLYLKYRTPEGRSTSLYIRREHEEEARAAVAAWAEMWQAMLDLSQANREALAQRVRRKAKG